MDNTTEKKQTKMRRKLLPTKGNPIITRKFDKPSNPNIAEIIMLTSYPPRECGIATFSSDLQRMLSTKFNGSFKLTICALETSADFHDYGSNASHALNTDVKLDFIKVSKQINDNPNCGMVLIQHEFGLFSRKNSFFNEFLEIINKPIVFTFHTVLPKPDSNLRMEVARMAELSQGIIVMTETSAQILQRDYDISPDLITVIPHGTHLVLYENKDELKLKYNLEGKKVLSTFGLLGPGKNIETTIDALPKIIQHYPETIFLILGKTHPTLSKHYGEDYREFLEYKIESLGLLEHVRFVNKFVPLDELLEYLQLTDIYLFTSKDPNQAVSGTFSYALSCGCPIVSTPIPHALEVLQNGAGILFDFEDWEQLSDSVISLFGDEERQQKMCLNGLHCSAESAWENAAIAYAKVFEKICDRPLKLRYKKPQIKLDHLKKMSTDTGIIQFSKINQPDISSGYTLDDNARALIAMCQHYELTDDKEDMEYIRRYAAFINNCFRPNATFLNYVDAQHSFTPQNDEVNLEDANGRAIWALGYLVSMSPILPFDCDVMIRNAECIFTQGLKAMSDFRSPRAMAFILKGLFYFNLNKTDALIIEATNLYANRLREMYNSVNSENWKWFESFLTYGNSVIPEAMLFSYELTDDESYKSVARESFDFLLSKIFKGNTIQVVSNIDWLAKGQERPEEFQGGEQPIDVAYTILALKKFAEVFPDQGYFEKMQGAFDWFMGNNVLNQTIYNPCTGGCYDGLEKHNVNLNQGAESTISYLLARMAFKNISE